MRAVIARIFDYSLDGFVASEGTAFFDYCRELPDDPAQLESTRRLYAQAALHVMGRQHYQEAAQYFPQALDHPYAEIMNAASKVVFSATLPSVDWAHTAVASGELRAEMQALTAGEGYLIAHGGVRFWRSLMDADLIDEYRITLFPALAGTGARLFDGLGRFPHLELVSAVPFTNGTVELTLRRTG